VWLRSAPVVLLALAGQLYLFLLAAIVTGYQVGVEGSAIISDELHRTLLREEPPTGHPCLAGFYSAPNY